MTPSESEREGRTTKSKSKMRMKVMKGKAGNLGVRKWNGYDLQHDDGSHRWRFTALRGGNAYAIGKGKDMVSGL